MSGHALSAALPIASATSSAPASRFEAPTTGTLLVLVHGWLLSGRLWSPLQEGLQKHRRVWAPDLPGCGTARRPPALHPTLAAYGHWLAQEAIRRSEGRPIVLVGHSLGGSIALHAAGELGQQLAAVVQLAAGGGIYQPRPFQLLRRFGRLIVLARPTPLGRWRGLDSLAGPLGTERRTAMGLLVSSTTANAVRQLPRLVSELTVPSLWISGTRDRVMDPRYVRHLAGYSRHHCVHVLEGAGHLPFHRSGSELVDVIEAWLESLDL